VIKKGKQRGGKSRDKVKEKTKIKVCVAEWDLVLKTVDAERGSWQSGGGGRGEPINLGGGVQFLIVRKDVRELRAENLEGT